MIDFQSEELNYDGRVDRARDLKHSNKVATPYQLTPRLLELVACLTLK